MKPIIGRDNFKYFPQADKFFSDLNEGEKFALRVSKTVYTKKQNGLAISDDGEEKYFPEKMPVIPMKKF